MHSHCHFTYLELHVLVLELDVPVPEVGLHGGDQVVRHVPLLLYLNLQLVQVLLPLLQMSITLAQRLQGCTKRWTPGSVNMR